MPLKTHSSLLAMLGDGFPYKRPAKSMITYPCNPFLCIQAIALSSREADQNVDRTHRGRVTHICMKNRVLINTKMLSYQCRRSHSGDETILRPSYLQNEIPHTDKAVYIASKPRLSLDQIMVCRIFRCLVIIWSNAGLLFIRPLRTNLSEIWIKTSTIVIQENISCNIACILLPLPEYA